MQQLMLSREQDGEACVQETSNWRIKVDSMKDKA